MGGVKMNTLIIYDSTGYIISQAQGAIREPQGIPFLWVDIPLGKRIKVTNGIGIDTTVTPNKAILEDIPKTEIETLQAQNAQMILALVEGGLM
jgi:hypothetical protein